MVLDGVLVPPGVLDVFEKKLRQLNPNLPTITYEFKDFAAYIDAIVSSQKAMSIQAPYAPWAPSPAPSSGAHITAAVAAGLLLICPHRDLIRAACCLQSFALSHPPSQACACACCSPTSALWCTTPAHRSTTPTTGSGSRPGRWPTSGCRASRASQASQHRSAREATHCAQRPSR